MNHYSKNTQINDRIGKDYRQRILSAARALFQKYGPEAVSMHQIAQTAGVGQGTLYRRYAHKGELCADLLNDTVEEFLQQLESSIAEVTTDTALDQLDRIIARIVDFTEEKATLLSIIKNTNRGEMQLTHLDHPVFHRLHVILMTLLQRALLQKETSELNPALAAQILLSALSPDLHLYLRGKMNFSKEEMITEIRRIYIAGLENPGK